MSQGFDQTKFAALVLYIAARSKDEPKFGAVKLNKILYYTDFNAYRRLGSAVAGASYQKLSEGPARREMPHTRSLLVDSRQARIEYRP